MSNTKIIIGIIIFALLIGGMFFAYKKLETPNKYVEEIYSNTSIYSTYNGKNIKTGYIIKTNNTFYTQGETLLHGSILEKVPINTSVKVCNKNLENQNFYTTCTEEKYILFGQNYRFENKLEKPSNISIDIEEINDNKFKVNLESDGIYKNIGFCLKWSLHILKIDVNIKRLEDERKSLQDHLRNLEVELNNSKDNDRKKQIEGLIKEIELELQRSILISNPLEYSNYDKCYFLGETLDSNSTYFEIEYEKWGELKSSDYIKIAVFDGDIKDEKGIFENEKGDICGENLVYELNRDNWL